MQKFARVVMVVLFIGMCFSCTHVSDDTINEPGNVIYSYKGGRLQCQSQIDSSGQLTILLKSLKENTTIRPQGLSANEKNQLVLNLVMVVEQENSHFKEWFDVQEVSIVIHPLPVETITLIGETIYETDKLKVIISN